MLILMIVIIDHRAILNFSFTLDKSFMMKYLLLVFFILVSSRTFAQSKNEIKIREILERQSNSWNQGDIEGFMNGYWENDSLMFIGKSGVTYGWTNTLNNYKKNYPDTVSMGKLAFTLIQLKELSKKYYQVTGKWFLKRSIGDIGGHFTLLFKKINGHWVIISDHSS
jgi:hypothetical protein